MTCQWWDIFVRISSDESEFIIFLRSLVWNDPNSLSLLILCWSVTQPHTAIVPISTRHSWRKGYKIVFPLNHPQHHIFCFTIIILFLLLFLLFVYICRQSHLLEIAISVAAWNFKILTEKVCIFCRVVNLSVKCQLFLNDFIVLYFQTGNF